MSTESTPQKSILHLCKREILRPLRDQILRISGYEVASTCDFAEALAIFHARPFDLVIVDVEGEEGITLAERFCAEVKTTHHGQLVAFVCNWRVAALTDCPDEIIRTEFNPAAFVAGVHATFNDAQHK
jgi:DNA-binding response OmpR family regulator